MIDNLRDGRAIGLYVFLKSKTRFKVSIELPIPGMGILEKGECWTTYSEIERRLGYCTGLTSRLFKLLTEKGFIAIIRKTRFGTIIKVERYSTGEILWRSECKKLRSTSIKCQSTGLEPRSTGRDIRRSEINGKKVKEENLVSESSDLEGRTPEEIRKTILRMIKKKSHV